jgi:hypothetical protein
VGLELILLYLGLAVAGGFAVDKGVELIKHSSSIEADKYNSCLEATKDARQCRTLE